MFDFEVLKENTPIVSCCKINDSYANLFNSDDQRFIYHKDFDITEFIGEKLASIRNVRSVHYFPGCFGEKLNVFQGSVDIKKKCIRTCSFDFKNEQSQYFSSTSLSSDIYASNDPFNFLLDNCKDEKNRNDFISESLELAALDIFMEQRDRRNNLIYEKTRNGELHLAPIFDYECSFYEKDDYVGSYFYECDLGKFCLISDYQILIDKFPELREILSSYLTVDLESEIREMFNERDFSTNNFDFDFYKRCDERNHDRIELILRR